MNFSPDDFKAVWLTLQLATATTLLLLLLATPLAWWLARTRSLWRTPVNAVVALPLVLPPTVLGFYLLVALGPQGPGGQFTQWAGYYKNVSLVRYPLSFPEIWLTNVDLVSLINILVLNIFELTILINFSE